MYAFELINYNYDLYFRWPFLRANRLTVDQCDKKDSKKQTVVQELKELLIYTSTLDI